jgi:hypothetical protein
MTAVQAHSPPEWLRHAVRGVLQQSPGYHGMQPEHRRALAQAMVKVSSIAAGLIAEEAEAATAIKPRAKPPLARAQDAPEVGHSADRVAGITQNVLNAVSSPT